MKFSQVSSFLKVVTIFVVLAYLSHFLLSKHIKLVTKKIRSSAIRTEFQAVPWINQFERGPATQTDPYKEQNTSLTRASQNSTKGSQELYAVTLEVAGQQGAGMHTLVSFQRLTAKLSDSVKILEPVMVNTEYYGISSHKSSIHFHDLFDLDYFNDASKSKGLPPFMLRKEFFATAPKLVTYVMMKQTMSSHTHQKIRILWSSLDNEPCYRDYKLLKVNKLLVDMGFCVTKVVELPSVKNYLTQSLDEIRKAIIDLSAQEQGMTVIFNEWRHYWFAGGLNFRMILRPSPRLLSDVEFYEKTFLNSHNDVAVMFRLEHIYRFLKHQTDGNSSDPWTLEKCFHKAIETTLSLQNRGRPMITVDLGKYGSATVSSELSITSEKRLTEKTISLMSPLFGDKISSFEEWEDSFSQTTEGVENSAYIAALQRTLASRAKCLILVGGGTFQKMSYDDYIINHPNKEDQCVNLICSLRSYVD